MRSRLLARLDAAIAKARNPVDAACLRAERAAFLARQGHLHQARRLIDQLQAQFAWRPHAAVSAWLSLAEGLHDLYSHIGPSARDRFQRAHALSGAAHLAPLHALAAAWLAHLDYVANDGARMTQHLAQALGVAAADHHSALSRACLVVAESYHYAGRLDRARAWYARSRTHATADGDDAHLSALMHNHAGLSCDQARMAALFDAGGDGAAAKLALMGAESTGRFDAGTGHVSLNALVPILRAQVLVALGRHAEALPLFEQHVDAALAQGLGRMKAGFLADTARCRLALGDQPGARADADAALAALGEPCDIDDRARAQGQLAQVLHGLGDVDGAVRQRAHAERDLQVHRGEQARLAALLDDMLAALDPKVRAALP